MDVAVRCSSVSQATRHVVALLFVSVLAGCATTPGAQFRPWNAGGPRALAAMSDNPGVVGEPTGPSVKGYNVPGRNPDSEMPWKFFLGNAAHRLIAYIYGVNHPGNRIFYNKETIYDILENARLGDMSRLLPNERGLRPDITDATMLILFEIKPWNDQGLQEGRQQAQIYLRALNRTLLIGRPFTGGTDFSGEILIRFAQGQHIWRLDWRTTEPGVVQYRWTRSQQRFASEAAAYEAGQWVDIPEQEFRQYGGWVGQAVEDMVSRRERLATFSGAVGLVIEVMGNAATGSSRERFSAGWAQVWGPSSPLRREVDRSSPSLQGHLPPRPRRRCPPRRACPFLDDEPLC